MVNKNLNAYGSYHGKDEVMKRGIFANLGDRNKPADKEGGYTRSLLSGEEMFTFYAFINHPKELLW